MIMASAKPDFIDHPLATSWLIQFDETDQLMARFLLRSLILVSSTSFEQSIIKTIKAIPNVGKTRVALVPIVRPLLNEEGYERSQDKYTSAAIVGNILRNLAREHERKYRVDPDVNAMRSERVNNIIFVDDILGSGKRILDYWREELSRSVKSWISYRKCKPWLVYYAGFETTANSVTEKIRSLNRNSIRINIELPHEHPFWTDEIFMLCEKYGNRTSRPFYSTGYGGVMAPIVFEHGCPNNTPSMLWSNGKGWKALFPNRAIPIELKEYFRDESRVSINSEVLAKSNQFKVALALLGTMDENFVKTDHDLLTLLSLLLQRNKYSGLYRLMFMNKIDLEEIAKRARKYGLLDNKNKVTEFGRDIVDRFRKGSINHKGDDNYKTDITYFPKQFSS